MKHRIAQKGKAVVISLEGDVDLQSSPDARGVLLEAVEQNARVVVDLSAVSYIDSSGIAALVEALQRSRQRKDGAALALAAVSDPVLRVLKLARLDRVFTIYPTLADVLPATR
jgi:anti-sigma B factor antagonist